MLAILTEYALTEAVGRSYTLIRPITYDESMEGRALPEAIENASRALFCEKKNGFNMRVNERGLGQFPFRPIATLGINSVMEELTWASIVYRRS